MLIGNKADLISQRQVSKEEGIKIAQVRTAETTDKVTLRKLGTRGFPRVSTFTLSIYNNLYFKLLPENGCL